MKVICIDEGIMDNPTYPGVLKEAEIYTVKGNVSLFSHTRKKYYECYILVEVPHGHAVDLFIPISDIDETTFERNYQKQTA